MADARFEALRAQLAQGLEPVEPLRPERWLIATMLFLVPLAGLVLWRIYGLRGDASTLGNPWLWGLSFIELIGALGLLIIALREAVPGRRVSVALLTAAAIVGAILHLATSLATFARSPVLVPSGKVLAYGLSCLGFEVVLGLPALALMLELTRRGLPTQARRIGWMGGLGAGLIADAIWRLICPFSAPSHVFPFHTSGLFLLIAVGALLALLWENARQRAWKIQHTG